MTLLIRLLSISLVFNMLGQMLGTAALAQSGRAISGVIAVSTAPVAVTYDDPGRGVIGRQAHTGDSIYLNDVIDTDAHTSVQILLKDQTVFSMGPNSSIIFDAFVYDPAGGEAPKLSATVAKGAFKFISGKVSQTNPEGMRLNLPNATASIRGTSVAGRVRDDGTADVVLLSGAITVNTPHNQDGVDIFTSGWGTTISAIGEAGTPTPFSSKVINEIIAEVEFEAPSGVVERIVETVIAVNEGQGAKETPSRAEIEASIAQAETVEDVIEIIGTVFAGDDGTINAADLSTFLLAHENLLSASNIDRALLEEEGSEGVNIDAALIAYALNDGTPIWSKLLEDDRGNLYFGNDAVGSGFDHLISSSYAGSARFGATGLQLSPSGRDAGSGSATADYSMLVDYDDMTINGTMSVYDVVMGGRSYDDLLRHSFATDIANDVSVNALNTLAEFELGTNNLAIGGLHDDGNGNGILNVGETFETVQVVGELLTDTHTGHNAFVRMHVSLGSITDGENAIDGLLGGVEIAVEEIDTTTNTATGNFINTSHFSKGLVE